MEVNLDAWIEIATANVALPPVQVGIYAGVVEPRLKEIDYVFNEVF